MSKVELILDIPNVRKEILQSDWMQKYIEDVAKDQASSDSHVKSFIGIDRAKSIIYPNTKEHPS